MPSRANYQLKMRHTINIDSPLACVQRMAMDIGTAIRERRIILGLSQCRLATRVGVHKQALSVMEKPGYMPSVRTLVRIASALGMPAWELLREAGE